MQAITLIKDNEKVIVRPEFKKYSQLVASLLEDIESYEIPLENSEFTVTDLKRFVALLEASNYSLSTEKRVIHSPVLQDNLTPAEFEFIKGYDCYSLKPLILMGMYLQLTSLTDLCFMKISCDIDAEVKKQELTTSKCDDIDFENEENFIKEHEWLQKENFKIEEKST